MVVVVGVVVVGQELPMVLVDHLAQLVQQVLVVLLVLGVRRVRRVLGRRVVLGLLVGLVVVVEVVGLLVRNTRVDKREHRMRDKEQRKPLAISCPFHVEFQPYTRQ